MKPWMRWALMVLTAIVVTALIVHGCKKVAHWCDAEGGE